MLRKVHEGAEPYAAPTVEMVEVAVEQGFAVSGPEYPSFDDEEPGWPGSN